MTITGLWSLSTDHQNLTELLLIMDSHCRQIWKANSLRTYNNLTNYRAAWLRNYVWMRNAHLRSDKTSRMDVLHLPSSARRPQGGALSLMLVSELSGVLQHVSAAHCISLAFPIWLHMIKHRIQVDTLVVSNIDVDDVTFGTIDQILIQN